MPSPRYTSIPESRWIEQIGRIDSRAGWVVTGGMTRQLRITRDGGATWSEPRLLPAHVQNPDDVGAIQFIDADRGWLLDTSPNQKSRRFTVHRTTDGGRTWTQANIETEGLFTSPGFHFRDALHGELFTARPLQDAAEPTPPVALRPKCWRYSTHDGGASWSAPSEAPCLSSITFVDASFGYASDLSDPVLFVTTDGGRSWTGGRLPVSDEVIVPSADFTGGTYLVRRQADGKLRAFALDPLSVLDSDDGGRSWTFADPPDAEKTPSDPEGGPGMLPLPMQAVALSDSHWLAINTDLDNWGWAIYSSSDGGWTWQRTEPFGDSRVEPFQLEFVNAMDGWAFTRTIICDPPGDEFCALVSTSLWATTDGGATWTQILRP